MERSSGVSARGHRQERAAVAEWEKRQARSGSGAGGIGAAGTRNNSERDEWRVKCERAVGSHRYRTRCFRAARVRLACAVRRGGARKRALPRSEGPRVDNGVDDERPGSGHSSNIRRARWPPLDHVVCRAINNSFDERRHACHSAPRAAPQRARAPLDSPRDPLVARSTRGAATHCDDQFATLCARRVLRALRRTVHIHYRLQYMHIIDYMNTTGINVVYNILYSNLKNTLQYNVLLLAATHWSRCLQLATRGTTRPTKIGNHGEQVASTQHTTATSSLSSIAARFHRVRIAVERDEMRRRFAVHLPLRLRQALHRTSNE